MARYIVEVSDAADAQLKSLDGSVRGRVIKRIQALKEGPRPSGCKKPGELRVLADPHR